MEGAVWRGAETRECTLEGDWDGAGEQQRDDNYPSCYSALGQLPFLLFSTRGEFLTASGPTAVQTFPAARDMIPLTTLWKCFKVETTKGCLSFVLRSASSEGPALEASDSMILTATGVPNQVA